MADERSQLNINTSSDGTDGPRPMREGYAGVESEDFFVQIRPKNRNILHVEGKRVADVRVYSDGSMLADNAQRASAGEAGTADASTNRTAHVTTYAEGHTYREGDYSAGGAEYTHRTDKYYDTDELYADEVFRDGGIHTESQSNYSPLERTYTESRADTSELGDAMLYGTLAEGLSDSSDYYDREMVGVREGTQYYEPVADTGYVHDGIEGVHGTNSAVVYEALVNEGAERLYGSDGAYDTKYDGYVDTGTSELYSEGAHRYPGSDYLGHNYNAYDEYTELVGVGLNNGEPIPPSHPEEEKPEEKARRYSCDLSTQSTLRKQRKRDIGYIESRMREEIRRAELDLSESKYSFSKKNSGIRGALRKRRGRSALKKAKKRLVAAVKYEKADNERYYRPLHKRFDKEKLPSYVDREVIIELREKLDRLLERRDELNIRLTSIYSGIGIGKGGSSQGRFDAEMKGRRKAYKKQERLARVLHKNKVRRIDREHLFDLMDKWVSLYGRRKKLEYMLGTEKIGGAYAKQLRRQRKEIIREARRLKRDIARLEAEVVVKARKKTKSKRNMIIGWSALIVLCAIGLGVYVFREQIWKLISDAMGTLFDQLGWTYFDTL